MQDFIFTCPIIKIRGFLIKKPLCILFFIGYLVLMIFNGRLWIKFG